MGRVEKHVVYTHGSATTHLPSGIFKPVACTSFRGIQQGKVSKSEDSEKKATTC